jgi:hypothetical protein
MIKVDQAEGKLRHMLEAAGVQFRSPDLETFWRVYKEFTQIPVEVDTSEDDALLFQWGRDRAGDMSEQGFYLDFTRQFCINGEDGEYDHMEQLGATLRYAQGVETEAGNFWSYDFGNSFDKFIEGVEGSEVFRKMGAEYAPYQLDIAQEYV